MAKKKEDNPFVGIAGIIGGISVAIVAIFLVFSPSNAAVTIPIVISLSVMGVLLGYFASKRK